MRIADRKIFSDYKTIRFFVLFPNKKNQITTCRIFTRLKPGTFAKLVYHNICKKKERSDKCASDFQQD